MTRTEYKAAASAYRRYLREVHSCKYADNYHQAAQRIRPVSKPQGFDIRDTTTVTLYRKYAAFGKGPMPLVRLARRHGYGKGRDWDFGARAWEALRRQAGVSH